MSHAQVASSKSNPLEELNVEAVLAEIYYKNIMFSPERMTPESSGVLYVSVCT